MSQPVKLSWKSEIFPILLILISLPLSFYFYWHWPSIVISHWNFSGQPDGYAPKTFMAFFFPILLLVMYLLFLIFPYLDPQKKRYQEFAPTYHLFKSLIMLVLFIVYILAGLYNLGYQINIAYTISLVIGLMMIVMGKYLDRIKFNWFMGIRTPWTLSSENVWNRTHRLGGRLLMIFGLVLIIMPYLPPSLALAAFIAGLLLLLAGTTIYSYLIFRQEKTKT